MTPPSTPLSSIGNAIKETQQLQAGTDDGFFNAAVTVLKNFFLSVHPQPQVLVCLREGCMLDAPMDPLIKTVEEHVLSHGHALGKESKQELAQALLDIQLCLPIYLSDVPMDKLPALKMPGVAVDPNGYRCTLCSYAVMSKSSMYKHVSDIHPAAIKKDSILHPVNVQALHQLGRYTKYVHITEEQVTPILDLPAPVTVDDTWINNKVDAFLKQDQEIRQKAGQDQDGVQPEASKCVTSPWLNQLGWHTYWAGKPVAAIGRLGPNPQHWSKVHGNFLHWVRAGAKAACKAWLVSFSKDCRGIRARLHAYSDDAPAKMHNIQESTINNRADVWSRMLTLLFHISLEGEELGYCGLKHMDETHLCASKEMVSTMEEVVDLWTDMVKESGRDITAHATTSTMLHLLLFQLSGMMVTQSPARYGHTEELALSRLFLHLLLDPYGLPCRVSAATSIIASLDYTCRAIIHRQLFDPEDGLISNDDATEEADAILEKHMKRYLYHNSSSANAHLQSLHRLGSVLSQDESTSFSFVWSQDRSIVTFGNEQIQISKLQTMVKLALSNANALMAKLLFQEDGSTVQQLDLAQLTDKISSNKVGFNFLEASAVVLNTKDCRTALLRKAVATAKKNYHSMLDPMFHHTEFSVPAAKDYFKLHDEFTQLLTILIELTGGMPARGTELSCLVHTNSLAGARNLFVHNGYVFTALASKKAGSGSKQKVVPRFLPHAVGNLVVHYLCQVLPFVRLLVTSVEEKPLQDSYVLLADHHGEAWSTSDISKKLQGLALQHLGSLSEGINIRKWRQLSTSIDRHLIRPKTASDAEEDDNVHDLQAGHSSTTANQHYGLDSDMLSTLTQESMDAMLTVSQRWHAFWQLPSKLGEQPRALTPASELGLRSSIKRQLEVFAEDLLQNVKQKLDAIPVTAPATSPGSRLASALCQRSAALPRQVTDALKTVTGCSTAKSLEQAQALHAIYQQESPLLIVLGTGSGKSALFLAPCVWMTPGTVVVVVVPFVALMHGQLRQAEELGITTFQWLGSAPSIFKENAPQLVFVAAEMCSTPPFLNWLQMLAAADQLGAMFFDECHVCITQDDFRPAMHHIKALVAVAPCPKYFLTATLPPQMVSQLKSKLLLPQDGTGVIRSATNRLNLRYAVKTVENRSHLLAAVEALVCQYPTGAVIIICPTQAEAKQTADHFRCACVQSSMLLQDKSAVLAEWMKCSERETVNAKRILAGTTAVGTGINPPHVNLVIHLGMAYSLVDYVQESGRAGRSGQEAAAVLVACSSWQPGDVLVRQYMEEETCRRLVLSSYMDGIPVNCSSLPGTVPCDLCQPERKSEQVTPPRFRAVPVQAIRSPSRYPDIIPAQQLLQDQREQPTTLQEVTATATPPLNNSSAGSTASLGGRSAIVLDNIIANDHQVWNRAVMVLQRMKQQCTLCALYEQEHQCGGQHAFNLCQCWSTLVELGCVQDRINGTAVGKLRSSIKRDKNAGCYSCLVPLNTCSITPSREGHKCSRNYSDLVLPVMAAILQDQTLRNNILRQMGLAPMSTEELKSVLGREVTFGGQQVFLAFAMFVAALNQ